MTDKSMTTTYVTPELFGAFLRNAEVGAQLVYARGNNFIRDCQKDPILKRIRSMAWDSPCALVQRRVPDEDGVFEYIAVKARRKWHELRPDPYCFTVGYDGEVLQQDGKLKHNGNKKPLAVVDAVLRRELKMLESAVSDLD